jgi:hypothetical protein
MGVRGEETADGPRAKSEWACGSHGLRVASSWVVDGE